ncbi:hypothetical protein [Haloferax volcanii]|uniref:hypothetical protein n=1 Tax=Haloferax volcanii TaxID=2246 RepID=UPI00385C9788
MANYGYSNFDNANYGWSPAAEALAQNPEIGQDLLQEVVKFFDKQALNDLLQLIHRAIEDPEWLDVVAEVFQWLLVYFWNLVPK